MGLTGVSVIEYSSNNLNFNTKVFKSQYAGNVIVSSYNVANAPSLDNLQAYYLQTKPSFGRLKIEHLQNGAYVDKTKNVFFKLLTFPDVKKVSVIIAKEVQNTKKSAEKTYEFFSHELKRDISEQAGIFKLNLGSQHAKSGDKYAFEIITSDNKRILAADPYAKRKTVFFKDPEKDPEGYLDTQKLYRTDKFAEIYDHNEFKWSDDNWRTGLDKRRISRLSNAQNGLKSFNEARILEINIPTFTKEGTFDATAAKIDKFIKKGWFKEDGNGAYNTIEIMPVETSNSLGWNYDGVYKNAVMEVLGGPDGLKRLVDYAHKKGINMIMDSVPNHFGIDYNKLREVGPYLGCGGGFGDKPNLENDFRDNKHVRDLIVNACGLNWLRDFHFDGLRLDLTHDMDSDFALRQLVNEVKYHEKHSFVTVEDARVYEAGRLTSKIAEEEIALDKPESVHAEIIKKYDTNSVPLNIGVDGRWGYEYEHAINAVCGGHLSVSNLKNEIFASVKRKDILYGARQSHDEKGNIGGVSEIVALMRDKLGMSSKVNGEGDCQIGQRAEQAMQAILESLVSGEYSKIDRKQFLAENHVNKDIIENDLNSALDFAISQNKISLGLTSILPSPKMRFQGTIEPFRFFRKFAINTEKDWKAVKLEKGYDIDETALNSSKLDSIPLMENFIKKFEAADQFERDINELAINNKAMSSGYVYESTSTAHDGSQMLGIHLVKDDSEAFAVQNFSEFDYKGEYEIELPKGTWKEVINSNDKKYAGNGSCKNFDKIESNGGKVRISIPANSMIVFEKVA